MQKYHPILSIIQNLALEVINANYLTNISLWFTKTFFLRLYS